jgi:multiple sugar transport system permease protein
MFICVAGLIGAVLSNALVAYAFARLRFPGRDWLFYGYLATMMIPSDVTMIPRFILVQKMGMFDTFLAICLPGLSTTFGTPDALGCWKPASRSLCSPC